MSEKNRELKNYAKSKGVYLYEIAIGLGMSESTFLRHLRQEFSEDELAEAKKIVDLIAAERSEQ